MTSISFMQALVSQSWDSKQVNMSPISPVHTAVLAKLPDRMDLLTTLLTALRSSLGSWPKRTAGGAESKDVRIKAGGRKL